MLLLPNNSFILVFVANSVLPNFLAISSIFRYVLKTSFSSNSSLCFVQFSNFNNLHFLVLEKIDASVLSKILLISLLVSPSIVFRILKSSISPVVQYFPIFLPPVPVQSSVPNFVGNYFFSLFKNNN